MPGLLPLFALLTLLSLLTSVPRPARAAPEAPPLVVAIADLPAFSTALVAADQGFFAAEGARVQVLRCVNGRRCLQHLLDGEAALATVADTPIVMAALAGARFDIVATLATSTDHRVLARTDRGIVRAADLAGKRLGVVKGTSAHFYADAFLLFHGVDPAAVSLVPLDPARAVQQIAAGEVDAAALYQPHVHDAAAALGPKAQVLPAPRVYTTMLNLVARQGAGAPGDEDVARVLRALRRAAAHIQARPAEVRQRLSARLGLAPALLDSTWGHYDFRVRLDQSLLSTLEAESRWALRAGLVPPRPLPDYLAMVRTAPLRTVDPRAMTIAK